MSDETTKARSIEALGENPNAGDVVDALNGIIEGVNSILENGVPGVGGGSMAVAVVENDSDAQDEGTAYFFSRSPYRGVGLYNTLVQEGSLTVGGVTYTYDPRKLYHLYEDGSFDEVEPAVGDITYQDNVVYYKGKRMTMQRYGDLICNHEVLYASTSRLAVLVFRVAGPFYADTTPVTLRYNDDLVTIHEAARTAGTVNDVERADGYVFNVNNTNYKDLHVLFIRRKADPVDNEYTSFLNVGVKLNNGYKETDIHVKFPKAEIFFKADPSVTTLAAVNQSLEVSGTNPQEYTLGPWDNEIFHINTTSGRLSTADKASGKVQKSQNIKSVTIDQTKRRKFYGVMYGDLSSNSLQFEATWENWSGYNTQPTNYPIADRIYWRQGEKGLIGLPIDFCILSCYMQEINHSFKAQYYADQDNPDRSDTITVVLRIRDKKNMGCSFDEIGLLTFDENVFDFSDEEPAVS